MGQTTVIKSI